jgi:hypothetical protein
MQPSACRSSSESSSPKGANLGDTLRATDHAGQSGRQPACPFSEKRPPVLPASTNYHVISTEAANAFVSSAVKKSASYLDLYKTNARLRIVISLLYLSSRRDLLLRLARGIVLSTEAEKARPFFQHPRIAMSFRPKLLTLL